MIKVKSDYHAMDIARHDLYNLMATDALSQLERKLTLEEAQDITDKLCCEMLLEPIKISFSRRFSGKYIGRAYYRQMKISLCESRGIWVSILLHEIAHLVPGSWNHNKIWGDNFMLLCNRYKVLYEM